VNVTSLTAFAVCPRKYYLQRYLGWGGSWARRFDPEDLPLAEEEVTESAAELGTMVHEILAGKAGVWPPAAMELAGVFERSALGRRASNADRVEREWDFIAEIENTMVRGTVDLWFEDERGRVIVDYKTDDVSAEEARSRALEYAPQLALYAIALGESRAFLHFLRPDVVVEVEAGAVAQAAARRLISALRSAQNSLDFRLHAGEHCHSCSFYRGLCPAEIPADVSGVNEEKSAVEAQ
jgi:CRISPR/Cas system-associated exonuclease Cas4 (RecB family)